jgi:SAM-dependent methyltransferase
LEIETQVEALREIYRVLRPGGRLGLVWNRRDARVPWVAQREEIVNSAAGDAPRFYTGEWRKVFPFPGFSVLHEDRFRAGSGGKGDHHGSVWDGSLSFDENLIAEQELKNRRGV